VPAESAGVILLTFDDHFTDAWVTAIPLFADHGARVTFFISEPHLLQPSQIDGLHRLAAAGHEIACHGLTHASAVDCLARHGPDGFLASEIDPAIDQLRQHGFAVRSYAYPRSQRSEATDSVLLPRFERLRSGWTAGAANEAFLFERCLVPLAALADRRVLIGKSIDQPAITDQQLDEVLRRTADSAACVTLYAHTIAPQAPHHHVTPKRLEALLQQAAGLNLRLIPFASKTPAP